MTDPDAALALLTEFAHVVMNEHRGCGDHTESYDDHMDWHRVKAERHGTRLLALLRDGLALERLPKDRLVKVTWMPAEEGMPEPVWFVQVSQGTYDNGVMRPWRAEEAPTLAAAVSAALDEPGTGE